MFATSRQERVRHGLVVGHGQEDAFFFFMVYKNTLHGDIKLKKIAGEFECGRTGDQAAM